MDAVIADRDNAERGWLRRLFSRPPLGPTPDVADSSVAPPSAVEPSAESSAALATEFEGCRRILVCSRKGGVGKTTTTLLLGHTLSHWRTDRVVALDADPDAGSLGYRVPRHSASTVNNLLAHGHAVHRYSDMRAFTQRSSSRLEVLAADDDPGIVEALGEREYAWVMDILEHHYTVILVDSGTGILGAANQGLLRMVDQVVVCSGPGVDAARAADSTLDWMSQHGHRTLVDEAVVVINQVRDSAAPTTIAMERHFGSRCRQAVRIPWDPALEAGDRTTLDDVSEATRQAFVELATAVVAGFTKTGAQTSSEGSDDKAVAG